MKVSTAIPSTVLRLSSPEVKRPRQQPEEIDLFLPSPPPPDPKWETPLYVAGAGVGLLGFPILLSAVTTYGSHHGGSPLGVAVGGVGAIMWAASAYTHAGKAPKRVKLPLALTAAGLAFRSSLTPGVVSGGLTLAAAIVVGGGAAYSLAERLGDKLDQRYVERATLRAEYEARLKELQQNESEVELEQEGLTIGDTWVPRD